MRTPSRTGPQVQYRYSLGAIRAAATSAGLTEKLLVEHDEVTCDLCVHTLKLEADGRYRIRVNGKPKPALFTLIAECHANGSCEQTRRGT